MIDFNATPAELPPSARGVCADIGLGKTRMMRERVAAELVRHKMNLVVAVPRHRLGAEIERDLEAAGISACVYRGRDADDPDAPGRKMCWEMPRAQLIYEALGSVSPLACQHGDKQCRYFETCGFQRQRLQRPTIWIVTHPCLFRVRPSFITQPHALVIDESFHGAALNGLEKPVKLWLWTLGELRHVPNNISGTADLHGFSAKLFAALMREASGRLRRQIVIDAGLTIEDLKLAMRLEWRRKIEITEIYPNMPLDEVQEICSRVAVHNQEVKSLVQFWKLLIRTIEAPYEHSPWLTLRHDELLSRGERPAPVVRMAWREDVHPSWHAPTLVLDGMMQKDIVRLFFPQMQEPCRAAAAAPFTRVRQITDRAMAARMLIPSERVNYATNNTRLNNVERVRRFIEVRANDMSPGRILVVCQERLEGELKRGPLPPNVATAHYNAVAGENSWNDVGLVIVVGRTQPPPAEVEAIAWVLFGTEVAEIVPNEKGDIWYPTVIGGIRLRNGTAVPVERNIHPDQNAEAVRWSICEAELLQAIGRGRAVNRSADNLLYIDILTDIVLPIEVDEVTTWDRIQPCFAQIMRARGAVPTTLADIATAYPDLFVSRDAAKMALARENPEQTLIDIEEYLIRVCSGFSSQRYRRIGARGPASALLYDRSRIEPQSWLAERIGPVMLLPESAETGDAAADG
jgi:putative DNA primase/helicase